MRLSAGGYYEIDGAALRRVSDVSPGDGAAQSWRGRQSDLWAESWTLMKVHHRLTDVEFGLWGAMHTELDTISRALGTIDRDARSLGVPAGLPRDRRAGDPPRPPTTPSA